MKKNKKCPCEICETFSCDWNIDRDLGLYTPNSNFTISDRKIIIGTYSANDYMGFIEIDIDYCPLCGISLKEVAE